MSATNEQSPACVDCILLRAELKSGLKTLFQQIDKIKRNDKLTTKIDGIELDISRLDRKICSIEEKLDTILDFVSSRQTDHKSDYEQLSHTDHDDDDAGILVEPSALLMSMPVGDSFNQTIDGSSNGIVLDVHQERDDVDNHNVLDDLDVESHIKPESSDYLDHRQIYYDPNQNIDFGMLTMSNLGKPDLVKSQLEAVDEDNNYGVKMDMINYQQFTTIEPESAEEYHIEDVPPSAAVVRAPGRPRIRPIKGKVTKLKAKVENNSYKSMMKSIIKRNMSKRRPSEPKGKESVDTFSTNGLSVANGDEFSRYQLMSDRELSDNFFTMDRPDPTAPLSSSCQICGIVKLSSQVGSARQHNANHVRVDHLGMRYRCTECGLVGKNGSNMRTHCFKQHVGSKAETFYLVDGRADNFEQYVSMV